MSRRKRSTEWQHRLNEAKDRYEQAVARCYDLLEGNSKSTGIKPDTAAVIESAIRHEYVTLDDYARILQESKS